jgi:hypothetical protein
MRETETERERVRERQRERSYLDIPQRDLSHQMMELIEVYPK